MTKFSFMGILYLYTFVFLLNIFKYFSFILFDNLF